MLGPDLTCYRWLRMHFITSVPNRNQGDLCINLLDKIRARSIAAWPSRCLWLAQLVRVPWTITQGQLENAAIMARVGITGCIKKVLPQRQWSIRGTRLGDAPWSPKKPGHGGQRGRHQGHFHAFFRASWPLQPLWKDSWNLPKDNWVWKCRHRLRLIYSSKSSANCGSEKQLSF